MRGKELVCIHYYYPPFQSIGNIRNHSISTCLSSHFDRSLILCSSNRHIIKDASQPISPNLSVKDCFTLDYRTISAWLQKNTSGAHKTEAKKKSKWFAYKLKLINSFPLNILFGEGGLIYWFLAFVRAVRFASNRNTTLIFTSFRPYSDLFCAYLVKTLKNNSQWVLDFRDLPYDPLYKNVLFPNYEKRVLKRFLKKADLLTTVSDGLAEKLKVYERPVFTFYNGVEFKLQNTKSKKFTISYTGSFYLDYRNPSFVFNTIKELIGEKKLNPENIQIVYAGKDGETFNKYISDHNLENIALNLGLVERKKALEVQMSSHINLMVTSSKANYSGILTGKLFEYLGVNTQILALVNGPVDHELKEIVHASNAGIVINNSTESGPILRRWLLSQHQNYLNGIYELTKNMDFIDSKFSWSNNVDKLLNKIGIDTQI